MLEKEFLEYGFSSSDYQKIINDYSLNIHYHIMNQQNRE